MEDFQTIIGQELKDVDVSERFFEQYIYGKEDLLSIIQSLLQTVGILLIETKRENLESDYGLILDDHSIVRSIHPDSPAYTKLMVGDVVQSKEIREKMAGGLLIITVQRNRRILTMELPQSHEIYFKQYRLKLSHSPEKLAYWKKQ